MLHTGFFSYLFTSCVLKDQMNFSKNLFFRILSSSPEPIDQCQPNLALSAAPVGDGLPGFFNEGIYRYAILKGEVIMVLILKTFRC